MLRHVDLRRLGRIVRTVRLHLRLTQLALSARCGVSQPRISRMERGLADTMPLADLERIARALDIRLSIDAWWRGGNLPRLLDSVHARLAEYVVGQLRAVGWEVIVEYTFNRFGERGSVDIVAWHQGRRALLLIEVKSRFTDLQEMLATFARKLRIVPSMLAEQNGWRPTAIGRLIVAPGTTANRSVVAAHANTFEVSYPGRAREAHAWVRDPAGPLAAIWFVAASTLADATSASRNPRARQPRQKDAHPA
jgi:transcriptional regulator with XRE-family HTH domain